jgi:ADP-ribose pyrophosphatase YjhB (NUDIX family)
MRPVPADPDAYRQWLAEGNATQARKRVAADVLIRDMAGRILLVNPTYKPGWDLSGGMAEANEPPHEAAVRELREELGLDVVPRGLLVVDWVPPHGPWGDSLCSLDPWLLVSVNALASRVRSMRQPWQSRTHSWRNPGHRLQRAAQCAR